MIRSSKPLIFMHMIRRLLHPVVVEAAFFVHTFERVRAKVVTLCLQQVRWQTLCTVAVVV